MKYIIGNWKAYKSLPEVTVWVNTFTDLLKNDEQLRSALSLDETAIVICPPLQFIQQLGTAFEKYPYLSVGAQDVSIYDQGKYTGEVPASTLKDMATYAILGHSERRSLFNETDADIETKTSQCRMNGIEPIVCIRGSDDAIPDMAHIIAYEPVESIGTGQNMNVSDVIDMKKSLSIADNKTFVYGGSVTKEKSRDYLLSDEINGLLIGSASLDPQHFYEIIRSGADI